VPRVEPGTLLLLAVVLLLFAPKGGGGQDPHDPPAHPRSEEVRVAVEGAVLAGRLYFPPGPGPHPAALLLAGSRDSRNLPGLGEGLADRGLVVLDLNKRGVGGSTGSWRRETLEQRRDDALAGLAFLASHPEADPETVGVIGHSQGGYVGPMVAAESAEASFLVLLAGPAEPVRDQILTHRRIVLEREGASETRLDRELGRLERRLSLAYRLRGLCRGLRLSYACGMIDHDPAPWLEAVRVPVLALFTAFDEMVPPAPNAGLMESALARAETRDVTIHVFPEGCHSFMPQAGPLEPMGEGFLPGFLEFLDGWIQERTAPSGPAVPSGGGEPQGPPPLHSVSGSRQVSRPPITVRTGRVRRRASGASPRISSERTTKSASIPGARVPSSSSRNAA
jgi:uncharacterized protein